MQSDKAIDSDILLEDVSAPNGEQGQIDIDAGDAMRALHAMSEGLMIARDGHVFYVNEAMARILKYEGTLSELATIPIDRWVHPDDLPLVSEHYYSRMDTINPEHSMQFRLVRTDGNIRWVTAQMSLTSWKGEPAQIACVRDITALHSQQEDTERSGNLFRTAFHLTPEIMCILRLKDGKLLDVNPAFINMFGYARDMLIDTPIDGLSIWVDPTFPRRFAQEFKMTASMMDVPSTMRTRGNMIRHFRLFAHKIDFGLEPVLLIVGRDVTDDLIQSQDLQRSRDTAELANRAKSEFLANMSHELRTPLNAILGFAEIVRDEILGPVGHARYKEYAGDIYKSGNHLLCIINDILDLSKVEAGRMEAQMQWIDPVPALRMALSLIDQRAREAQLLLGDTIRTDKLIEADERLIKQICINLLSNSVKFTNPGGRVTLSLEESADGGLVLSVEDTGIGMTPDEIRIARRPFGQVDSGLSRKHEGSGLGLPLVAAFAEQLGATMRIVSMPGQGTRVSLYFPPNKVHIGKEAENI